MRNFKLKGTDDVLFYAACYGQALFFTSIDDFLIILNFHNRFENNVRTFSLRRVVQQIKSSIFVTVHFILISRKS